MRAVIQRVSKAKVSVKAKIIGQIGSGLLVFIAIHKDDDQKDIDYLVNKIANLRIFADGDEYFQKSVLDLNKEILIISQFTLYGECKKGRRPDFFQASSPKLAKNLYNAFVDKFKETGLKVAEGEFQAMMDVELTNEGPVTLILDS